MTDSFAIWESALAYCASLAKLDGPVGEAARRAYPKMVRDLERHALWAIQRGEKVNLGVHGACDEQLTLGLRAGKENNP